MANLNKTMNEICNNIVGKSVDIAMDIIKVAGLEPRLREVNGQSFMGTTDVKPNRVNLKVVGATKVTNKDLTVQYVGGKVTSAYPG